MFTQTSQPKPTLLADEQWEALGRRLARLERLIEQVPELGQQAVAAQLQPVSSNQAAVVDRVDAVVQQLEDVVQQQSMGVQVEVAEFKHHAAGLMTELLNSNELLQQSVQQVAMGVNSLEGYMQSMQVI